MMTVRRALIPFLLLFALALSVAARPDDSHKGKDKDEDKDRKKDSRQEDSQRAPDPASLDIQRLIDNSPDGSRVVIPRGRHVLVRGLVVANRNSLTLYFEPDAYVLVDDIMQDVLTIENSGDIRVVGGSMRHLKPSPQYQCHGSVVRVRESRKVTLEGCELNGCGATGVHADGAAELLITRCHIHHNTFNAFYLSNCTKVNIIGNVVEENANTLDAHQVDQLTMSDNLIRHNGGYWRPRLESPGPMAAPDKGREKGKDRGKE